MKFEDSTMFYLCINCDCCYDVKDGKGHAGFSHGVCPDCYQVLLEQAKTYKTKQKC